jgi:hypothetical protein
VEELQLFEVGRVSVAETERWYKDAKRKVAKQQRKRQADETGDQTAKDRRV